jgi:hypothetical protein
MAYGDNPPAKEAKEDPIAGILEGYLNGPI